MNWPRRRKAAVRVEACLGACRRRWSFQAGTVPMVKAGGAALKGLEGGDGGV